MSGRTAILVDDGLATGATMRAAVLAAKRRGAARVVVAVPVAAAEAVRALAGEADEIVCVMFPRRFRAIGQWYDDFSQVSDQEVQGLLELTRLNAGDEPAGGAARPAPAVGRIRPDAIHS